MNSRFIARIGLLVALMGAGCSSFVPTPPTPSVDSGSPSPEGVIAYMQGFGLLPGKNPNPILSVDPDIRVELVDLLPLTPTVTVIRKRRTVPNDTVLQNLTSAINVPVGALGAHPKAKQMSITWDDESGFRWNYEARTDHLSFDRVSYDAPIVTTSLASDEQLTQAATNAMIDRGLMSTDWSSPYVVFSWKAWWDARIAEGKCMTKSSLSIIKRMAIESSLDYDLLPSLSKTGSSDCVNPEFPNYQVVRYSLSKDGLRVFERDGMPTIGGEVVVRLDTQEIVRGWVELKHDADRSNYESLQKDRLETYLKQGGILGFPKSTASYKLTKLAHGSYHYSVDVNGEQRTFYIPAVQGEGLLTFKDGTTTPYAVIVPLTREDQFEGR